MDFRLNWTNIPHHLSYYILNIINIYIHNLYQLLVESQFTFNSVMPIYSTYALAIEQKSAN